MLLSLECNGCKATLTSRSKKEKTTTKKDPDTALEANADTAHEGRKGKPSYKKKHIAKFTRAKKEEAISSNSSDEETTAMLSWWSFTSDSAEYYSNPYSSRKMNKHKTAPPPKRGTSKTGVISRSDDRVHRGIAVELRSTDLYGDFWRSMVEMIMAEGKLRAGDMNRLLLCYLSVNSPEHHPVIIEAFSDVYCCLQQMVYIY